MRIVQAGKGKKHGHTVRAALPIRACEIGARRRGGVGNQDLTGRRA